jgi:two-component system chemotaxis response regulator CheB
MSLEVKNIITVGASAGGITAVSRLLSTLNARLNAAVFIVIHVSRNSLTSVILAQIQRNSTLKCIIPEDGEKIKNGHVYLAPADLHLMIETDKILVRKGAFENHWRPSIDVLFRTAAAAYGACVTGIVLTGLLDDGTSGMSAIKRSGGMCMVQDPAEADFPDMPRSVLENIAVDYKVPIADMGYILSDLFSRAECEVGDAPEDVKLEAKITKRMSSEIDDLEKLGALTPFTCPDCGGSLVKMENEALPRYRCYTGHSFTEKSLENEQIKGLEDSLWVAIRMMEERKNLLHTMTGNADESKVERALQMGSHIKRLKKMLTNIGENKMQP